MYSVILHPDALMMKVLVGRSKRESNSLLVVQLRRNCNAIASLLKSVNSRYEHSPLTNVTGFEKTLYGIFCEDRVWCIFDKLYHRANYLPSPRHHALCSRSCHTPENKKLQSKGVAMHAYGISVYYEWTGNQLNGLGRSRSKWKPRLELRRRQRKLLLWCLRS